MNNRLKELRMYKGLSQKEFAQKFNEFVRQRNPIELHDGKGNVKQITYSAVSRWENGSVVIPSVYYKSLADFFGVPVSYLQGLSSYVSLSYLRGLSSRKQIKNRIGDVRICKGISQRKLAKIINVSNQAISAYECGIRKPKKENWQALADYFDVSVPYLQGYSFAECHWCGNEFILTDEKDRDRYFYCPYCGRSPLDFEDKKPSAKAEHQDEKKEFLKLENEKDTLDDAIGFLNELISTSEGLTNTGKSELTKVVRVLYNIYFDDTHACWKTK